MKPYEVELCVAEVGDSAENDQLYRLTFDGSIVDEPDFVVMGGQAEAVTGHLREHFSTGMGLSDALQVGVRALSAVSPVTAGAGNGGATQLTAAQLEVAVLDRRRPKRAFRRVTGSALRTLLGDEADPGRHRGRPGRRTTPPSVPEPGTPPGLGDPANPDTAGGAEDDSPRTDGRRPMPTYRVNKDGVAKARELIDAGKYDDDDRVVRRRALGRRRERRDRQARLRRLRRLAPRDRPGRLRGDQGPLQVPLRRLREGQPGSAHPRQAARRAERPRRDREGRRPAAPAARREARRLTCW